jgi:uncharacterized protein (TIGR00730 family)
MQLHGASITVFCGSSAGNHPAFSQSARALGQALAQRQVRVIYGGASVGLMGAVADSALASGGQVWGIIPQQLMDRELAHNGLTTLTVVASMHERKTLMSQHASGYVVLPGGYGTWEEFFEVVTWKQLGLHKKPIILLNVEGYYDALLSQVDHGVEAGFMRPAFKEYILPARSVEAAMSLLETYAEPAAAIAKWT